MYQASPTIASAAPAPCVYTCDMKKGDIMHSSKKENFMIARKNGFSSISCAKPVEVIACASTTMPKPAAMTSLGIGSNGLIPSTQVKTK